METSDTASSAGAAPHAHLQRLERVFVRNPVYFITTCTHGRARLLDQAPACAVLAQEWRTACERHGWLIGRYVVMPDHVHFFCAPAPDGRAVKLAVFMQHWKEWTAKGLRAACGIRPPVWQKQFFDHVLRSHESYAEKWGYVRENPVRAGLVAQAAAWTYQGWIDFDAPL